MCFDMIAAKDVDFYVCNKSAFLIDLRTSTEYVRRHIKGAVNIPYERFNTCLELPRCMTIIVYCERGSVSILAAKQLAAKGYRVKTVIGGINAYRGKYLECFN